MLQRQERSCTCSGSETTLKVSGGTCAFLSCPSTFLALQVQLVALVSAFVMVSTAIGQFLVCCSSTHGAPPCPANCKSEGPALVPYGVGATVYVLFKSCDNSVAAGFLIFCTRTVQSDAAVNTAFSTKAPCNKLS